MGIVSVEMVRISLGGDDEGRGTITGTGKNKREENKFGDCDKQQVI